jgi:hypothetical protein
MDPVWVSRWAAPSVAAKVDALGYWWGDGSVCLTALDSACGWVDSSAPLLATRSDTNSEGAWARESGAGLALERAATKAPRLAPVMAPLLGRPSGRK